MDAAADRGEAVDCPNLAIRDAGANPTGMFKARGMAATVSLGKELGLTRFAGNAASALAAYAVRAGFEAHIFMLRAAPRDNYIECKMFGARVTLVDGLISDCGRIVAERKDAEGWFDVDDVLQCVGVFSETAAAADAEKAHRRDSAGFDAVEELAA